MKQRLNQPLVSGESMAVLLKTVMGLALVCVGVLFANAATITQPESTIASLGRQSITFEANRGQSEGAASFIARGPAYYFSLSPTEATVSLRKLNPGSDPARFGKGRVSDDEVRFRSVRLEFVGANPKADISGQGELPGRVNYFIGGDNANWRTGLPLFTCVRVTDMYPGINLVHYGNQQHLEYDFEVAPGADPSVIAIRFEGADCITINSKGELVLSLDDDEIRQPKPIVYQTVGERRKEISGAYVLTDSRTVKFVIGEYDSQLPLVIDPVLSYSTYYGGSGWDTAYGVAVDAQGFIYVAGESMAGLPVTSGTLTNRYGGTYLHGDAFVAKFDSSLSNLLYLTYVGGTYDDVALSLAVDGSGSAYITGYTDSQDFPRTNAIFDQIKGTPYPPPVNVYRLEAFITKLGPAGTNLVYSTYLGGSGVDLGFGIAVDPAGNAYVAGATQSSDFPTANVTGGFTNYSGGYQVNDDAFVTKVGPFGTNLIYSMFLGGANVERARAIAADAAGQAYVTGFTRSQNFPVTTNAVQPWLAGGTDAFITVVGAFGSNLVTSTYLGGTGTNDSYQIKLDANSNIYLTGLTVGDIGFPTTPGSLNPGGVFKSVNDGAVWNASSVSLPSTRVFALTVDPQNPLRLYAGTSRGVARSVDAGATWITQRTVTNHSSFLGLAPFISVGSVFATAVNPVSPTNVYAGTAQGVFKSTDSGLSWSLSSVGLNVSSALELVVDPVTPAVIYAAGNAGVFRSTNSAATWEARNSGLGNFSVSALAIHPTNNTTLYVATAGGVYRTRTSGLSWEALNNGLVNLSVQALVIDPITPTTLYVGTAAGVFKSTNAGTNWIAASIGLTTSNITALAINPLTPAILYAGTTNGLFKTLDAGQAWSPLTNGFPIANFLTVAINPQSPNTVYTGTRGTNFYGGNDAFVTRLGSNGFSTILGGSGDEEGWDLALGTAGRVVVVGSTTSTNLPTLNTSGLLRATKSGGRDVFVAEFNQNNQTLLSSAYLGGVADDWGYGVALDASGNTYIVGETSSGNFPTLGALQGTYGGSTDAFIARITNTVMNPLLAIQSLGNQVRLSWSALAVGFHLQSNTNLSGNGWVNVPTSPVESNGVFSVSLPATSAAQFFRLSNP